MKRGPHTLISTEDIYINPWIRIHEDRIIRPNGKEGLYGIVEYPSGVTTIAVNSKREVHLVQEYLYAVDEYGITLPGGGIDEGETPLDAAKRELREETGAISQKWIDLGSLQPAPMIMNNTVHLFLAMDAEIDGKHEEEFTLLTLPFDEVFDMVMSGKIKQAQSCIAILKAKQFLSERSQ